MTRISSQQHTTAPLTFTARRIGIIGAGFTGALLAVHLIRFIDHNGHPVHGLHALGPLTRGAWWEIVAVPELRNQAARFARQLANAGR